MQCQYLKVDFLVHWKRWFLWDFSKSIFRADEPAMSVCRMLKLQVSVRAVFFNRARKSIRYEWKDTEKREREQGSILPWKGSRVPARTLNLLNGLARAWNASISQRFISTRSRFSHAQFHLRSLLSFSYWPTALSTRHNLKFHSLPTNWSFRIFMAFQNI